MSKGDELEQGPSWHVKTIVLLTLAMLLVAGTRPLEAWPFTGWRLYSNMKGPTAGTFVAYRVGPDGAEHAIDYSRLPYSYQRAPYRLKKMDRYDRKTRESVCDALAHGERAAGRPVAEIAVYWEVLRVVPRDGERHTKLVERELRYQCAKAKK